MKLQGKEFKRFKELETKVKAGKATDKEKQEYESLLAKKKDVTDKETEFKPGNDFSWWNKIPQLIVDSASFKCNWIPGTAIAPGAIAEPGYGVMEVTLAPVLGNSSSVTDPLNVWARDLYLRMFQKYRPASGYSASDLGMAILGAYECVKLIAMYERIYGVINRYSRLNANMPVVEALALGLSSTQLAYLQGHMSDFRYDLNFLIRKAQRLCIPKDMSIIADAISLFGYEYADHQSVRSQIIIFNVDEYGLYSDTNMQSGGSIEYRAVSGLFNFNADNMCVLLDSVLNALLGSDSVQRIFADLVVWFGTEAMLEFIPVPSEYTVVPVYSESILHKLHNLETYDVSAFTIASFVDGALNATDQAFVQGRHVLYQADDRLVSAADCLWVPSGATVTYVTAVNHGNGGQWAVSSAGPTTGITLGHALDTAHNDITPDIIVEGAMWKPFNNYFIDTSGGATILESCTFYVVRNIVLRSTASTTGSLTNVNNTASVVREIAGYMSCIDWAPLCYALASNGVIDNIYGDYDNICYVSNPDLSRIQRTIVLSGLETDVKVITK